MKVTNLDERIHVLDASSDVMTVIRDIGDSGVQEEAFYVLDVGDIVRKHQIWKEKLPRVDPHYGTYYESILRNLISTHHILIFESSLFSRQMQR